MPRNHVLEQFSEWDADGNGSMERAEMLEMLRDWAPELDSVQANSLIDAADCDKNGVIDYVEFVCWLYSDTPITPAPVARAPTQPKPCRFQRIQFIALELCTMPQGFDTKHTAEDDWYIGVGDCPTDIRKRVALLGRALAAAAARVDPSPETLKLFMAPEFLFRGPTGAYKLEHILGDVSSHNSLQSQLASLVLGEQWKDWICVFGTVVGYTEVPNEERAKYEVYNVALVQEGGHNSIEAASAGERAVIKKACSGIDFLHTPSFGFARKDVRHVLEEVDGLTRPGGDPLDLDDDGIFTLGGVTFGMEICLDHKHAKLRSAAKSAVEHNIQVQLVPSAGMRIRPNSICAQTGGYVFQCEGLKGHDGFGAMSAVLSVCDSYYGDAEYVEAEMSFDAFGFAWETAVDSLYTTSVAEGPKVCIYPPVVLPASV